MIADDTICFAICISSHYTTDYIMWNDPCTNPQSAHDINTNSVGLGNTHRL